MRKLLLREKVYVFGHPVPIIAEKITHANPPSTIVIVLLKCPPPSQPRPYRKMPIRPHAKFWKAKMPSKELSEMTLDELWRLFPISLVEHDGKWKAQYEDMEKSLADLLSDYPVERISHVGSTAVAGIWAKDIVDVLVELAPGTSMEAVAKALERAGFIVMSSDGARVSLNLGYTKAGFAKKVFHVHLRHAGDNDELYFRDYLNDHTQLAREYEALKLQLWKQFENDRDAYTNGKSDFIAAITEKAKEEYVGRY